MGYKKANCILPKELLTAIQQHIDGECIYIPRKAGQRKQWGECSKNRGQLAQRNRKIFEEYRCGISVEILSSKYYLSPKTIYKILSAMKKSN